MRSGREKICVVLTTINSGEVLEGYCDQAEKGELGDRLRFVVIPDKKSPKELYGRCGELTARGFDIKCPTIPEQDGFLNKLGKIAQLIPYNSDNRRNIGFLMALEWGCDLLLSIDDDNFCLDNENVYAAHSIVCDESVRCRTVQSSDGWFNVCELLDTEPNYVVYPRGFPYHKRHTYRELTFAEETGPVRLNAGLWLQDPDLDALTWLAAPVRANAFRGESLLLGANVWSPINTQNTSLHRDLVGAYYFVRMGYPLAGMPIDRYGDIFSGYLVQACMQHMGDRVRMGTPVAEHRRNSHNYMRDLAGEIGCIFVLEDLTQWLQSLKLEGTNYGQAYLSLADAIDDQVEKFTGAIWTDSTRAFFHETTFCMREWITACRRIG